jgi:predicted HicB family RNase H-like nuclease
MKMNWAKVFFIASLVGTAGLVAKIHMDQEESKRERRESVMKYLEEQKNKDGSR